MPSDYFKQANKRGKKAENLLAEILESWNVKVTKPPDRYFADYDLKLSTQVTIEVKYDILAQKTGNLCLELEALNHSQADVLAIAYGKPITAFYLLPMERVRAFANNWHKKRNVGEFGTESAIVKRTLFLEKLAPEIIDLQTP